jgi:hypothetical protein
MASGCSWSAASWTTPAGPARSRDAGAAANGDHARPAHPAGWRRPGTGHWTLPSTPDRRHGGAACGNQYGSSLPTTTMRSSKASAWCCRRGRPGGGCRAGAGNRSPAGGARPPARRAGGRHPDARARDRELVRLVGTAQPPRPRCCCWPRTPCPPPRADLGSAGTTRAVSGHELAEAIRQVAAGAG